MGNGDTKHWIDVCSDMIQMIGVLIGIMAATGIVEVTIATWLSVSLLGCALYFFSSSKAANSKIVALQDDRYPDRHPEEIKRLVPFAESRYGVAFTLFTMAITVITWKFFGVIAGIIVAVAPWIAMEDYSRNVMKSHFIHDKKSVAWFIMELTCLIFLLIDYLGVLNWI